MQLYGLAIHCYPVNRLYIMRRSKWEESHANAADRGDRVQSVRNRVYSIIYRSSISVQFVGVQFFLLRVNRACKACTASIAVAVGSNLDKPLEAVVVEQSRLPVVHCSSLTGLLESWSVACSSIVGLGVALSLVHRWSIAGPSLVHRASLCSSVPRASCVRLLDSSLLHRWSIAGLSAGPSAGPSLIHLFLCHSCIARPSGCCSVPRASLMRRSSACLCTARPSACAPLVHLLVHLMVRLLESRSLLHRWVEGYRTSGRRGCSFGVAGDGIVKACSIESNGGSERKTAC